MKNYNLGSWIAGSGIVVSLLAHFGLGLDATQVGKTITEGFAFAGDVAIIYGTVHQWISTKKVVTAARAGRAIL